MNPPDTIATLFAREPINWGLRGDPPLWREMQARFCTTDLPASREALVAELERAFVELTAHSVQAADFFKVARFDHGGMSSGMVDPGFWRDTAFPLLVSRYVAHTTRVTSEQIRGGLYGLLVGDALGVPYEFCAPEALPELREIEMEPPPGFRRAHRGVPTGTWSDDGAQALCLLASLLHQGRMDAEDFARRMVNWYEHGYMAVDDKVFDVGVQTAEALRAISAGQAMHQAARKDAQANGNGALMRVLPLALWHRGSDAELVSDAHVSSLPTHGHPRSGVCCALYCLWLRRTLERSSSPWTDAIATLREILRSTPHLLAELNEQIKPEEAFTISGSGYVVDTLHGARAVQASGSYQDVVRAAIALGHDTDTTAAVAGGVAGVRHGLSGIPARWLDALRGTKLVEPLVAQLLAWRRC